MPSSSESPHASPAPIDARGASVRSASWWGPRILVVGFVSYLISTGFIFSIFGVFIRPMAESFGASMATMGLVPVLYHLTSSTLSPLLGRRYALGAIRGYMLAGACLLPAGLLAVSRSESLAMAALSFTALTVVGSILMGPLAANTLVNNWYGPSRGRAFGLASAGSTVAGMSLPPLAAFLIGLHGWRDALPMLALLGASISLPTFLWLAVDRPSQIGQQPEGAGERPAVSRGDPAAAHEDPSGEGIEAISSPASTGELLGRVDFWAISAMFGLLFGSGLVSVTYTVPYSEQLGLTLQSGAWILALRSLSAFAGQIGLGWVSDRLGRRPVLWGAIALEFCCWLVIAFTRDVWAFAIAGIGVGFVGGSFVVLRGALISSVFRRRDFSTVSGLMVPASLPFQVLAVPLAGYLFDRSGDYAVTFRSFLVVFPVAALLLLLIRDRPAEEHGEG